MPRAAAIRRLPRDREDSSFSPPARRTRLALAMRAEQEATPIDATLPAPAPAPRRVRGRPRININDRQPGSSVVRASSNSNSSSVVRSRGAPSAAIANIRAQGTTSGTSVRVGPAGQPAAVPAAGSGVVNRRTPAVPASRRGASNSSSAARSNRAPTAAGAQRQLQVFANAAPAADVAQPQRQPAVDGTASQRGPAVAAAQRQPHRQPQVVADAAQSQAAVPQRSQAPIPDPNPVSAAPPAPPSQNRRANLPQIVPPVVPAVVAQQNAPAPNNPVGNQAPVAAPVVAVVQQPIPAAVPAPVVQQPIVAPAPAPVVQQQIVASVRVPVVQQPIVAPAPAPVVQQPIVAPAPAPVVQQPIVAPAPAPVVQQPIVAPAPAPVVQQPIVAPAPAPVVQQQIVASVRVPVVQQPIVAPAPAPVVQQPIVAPAPAPVVQQQIVASVRVPVVQQPIVASVRVPVVQQPIVASVQPSAAPVQPVAASAPLPDPGAMDVVAVAQQPNIGVATNNRPRAAINARRSRAGQLPAPAVASRIQVADNNAGPMLLHAPGGQPISMLLQIHPRSVITVRKAADYFANRPDAVKELHAAVELARREDPRKSAVRVQVFPPAPDAEAEAAGTRTPAVETLVFDGESIKDLPETVQGFVERHAPNLLVRITVIKGRAAIPESPMPKRDDTVIRSDDWGDCTICFEDLPYDPVGCLYCRQMIGCRFCVKQWIRSGREAAAAHPNNPEAGRNHRQCPLCRHEWDWEPEVTSMFVLRGGA